MKIAYCIHSLCHIGGMERGLVKRVNYLADKFGYEVYVLAAFQHGKSPKFALSPKVTLVDLRSNDTLLNPFYPCALKRALKSIRPDICISLGGNDIFALPHIGDGSVKIAEFHFSHQKYRCKYGDNLFSAFRTRCIERVANKYSAFVVLTKSDAGVWAPFVPSVMHIYNSAPDVKEVPAPLDSKVCVSVGRLVPQKNFREMIDAWSLVNERHPDWKLLIYGEGKLRKTLEKQILDHGLSDKVLLMGPTSDVDSAMLGASCLVMSSIHEGFPNAMLEAASCGVPMINYDCPAGPSEIIVDGVNGYLVKYRDVEMLADRICRVIENPELRKSMGAAAMAKSREFPLPVIMDEWDVLFRSLVNKSLK